MTPTGVQTLHPSMPRLRSHGLAGTSALDVVDALRAADPAHAARAWSEACAATGIDPFAVHLTPAELTLVTGHLIDLPSVLGLTGRALGARVAVYAALAPRADRPGPPWDWARESMDRLLRTRALREVRTDDLLRLAPFSDSARHALDRTAARAATRLGTSLGLVTIVLDGAALFAGSKGLGGWMQAAGGVPVEWAFCATPVRTGQPLVIPDTRAEVLHRLNPLAVHDGAAGYAGAPLTTSGGAVLGTVCVISDRPRAFTAEDVAVLQQLADEAVAELESRCPATPVAAAA